MSLQSNCYSATFRKHQQNIKGIGRSTVYTKPHETKKKSNKTTQIIAIAYPFVKKS
jgi:hypothetical protein